jgi:hypothetical protein
LFCGGATSTDNVATEIIENINAVTVGPSDRPSGAVAERRLQ